MPRLFTGLEIPAELGVRLSMLRGGLFGATWIDPENYHITLRFVGDIDDRTAEEVASELGRIRRRAFEVSLEEIDSFGGRQPHSVVAKVGAKNGIMELQAEHERVMQRLGLEPEPRRFTPHVTIARTKGASNRAVADWLAIRGGLFGAQFKAARFVLFSSRSSRGGGPYVIEESYPLAA
ncbi:RNA 2',3'-cyclic phosphodiesterase [Methyloraptor flagellatus]|jgi:2'-5' RNA ligase|uniref:RNA 2',3'-cyclic phosphodiesterase n=1 Tax=Methyloraptor flagellatus TaxID=3162530 RepID=A0AAU7XC04_9HYPH